MQLYPHSSNIIKTVRKVRKIIQKLREYRIYNPGQNIWNKMEESSKTGQEKKNLVSVFAYFLTDIDKV